MKNQWAIKRDKQLAEQNKQELDKQAFRESERIERNDMFQEWAKCFSGMVKK